MTIYLLDPTCILEYGHNLPALKRYEKICSENGYHAKIHVCKEHFSTDLDGVVADLAHCYGFGGVSVPENKIDTSVKDLERFFVKNNDADIIFFINIDYFSLCALNLLSDKIVKSNKKLIVRLIGVMENDVGGIVDETKFIPQLEMLKSKLGARLKIGAETLGYAEFLSASINCQVDYLPFPLTNNCTKKSYQELKSIKFGFLGAPREDKGYNLVPNLIYSIKGILPSAEFVIQGEKEEDKIWDSIQFYIKSDITYAKSPLEHGVILDLLAQCNFVILPYDENVYKHRGSAIMFEALEVGVPCITFMNPAFARDIETYKIGLVFNSIRELEIKELVDFYKGYESNRLKYIALTNEAFLNSLRFI